MAPLRYPSVRRRPFGVRLYLAFAFAAVAIITAALAYVLVGDTGNQAADEELSNLAIGRTVSLADAIGRRPQNQTAAALDSVTEEGFSAFVFDSNAELISPQSAGGTSLFDIPNARRAVTSALIGSRFVEQGAGGVAVVGIPIFREGRIAGALVVRSVPPSEVTAAIDKSRGDRLAAVGIAVLVALMISFLTASAITSRVKRLAESAARISEGGLDEPLEGTGGATRSPISAGRSSGCGGRCARRSAPCARSATGSRRSSRRSPTRSWSSAPTARSGSRTPPPTT